MRRRWGPVVAAATLGATALVLAPFAASRAPAGEPLPIYQAMGAAKGIDVQFALRPNIFDPLMQFAAGYAETRMESSGGGATSTIASSLYPGSLILGARGCAGMPGTSQAAYPPSRPKDPSKTCGTRTPKQETTLIPIPAGPLSVEVAHMKAQADLAAGRSEATLGRISFAPSHDVTISIASVSVAGTSVLTPDGIEQTAISTAAGISIALPGVRIDIQEMISRASTSSDGDDATPAATLTFGDVTATMDGQSHRAFIDSAGIHIGELGGPTPPANVPVPDDIRQPLSQRIQYALGSAGLDIRLGGPVEIRDGARAESSVGGLVISFASGRPPYPPLPPPPTPIPRLIPNHCFGKESPPPVPILPTQSPSPSPIDGFCVGPGVLPIPPGDAAMSLSIGGADALAIASHGFVFDPGGGGFIPPPSTGVGDGGFTGTEPVAGGLQPSAAPQPGGGEVTVPAEQPRTVGLVANLPSAALMGSGLFLIVLALGLAWAPSLRP